jgi:hypothetical protein
MYPTKQFYLTSVVSLTCTPVPLRSNAGFGNCIRPPWTPSGFTHHFYLFNGLNPVAIHHSLLIPHFLNNITNAVAIILINASGISFFHPRFINWSYRKRGMVQRIQINTNKKKNDFASNTTNPMMAKRFGDKPQLASFTKGISYPPKNNVDITAPLINILTYSANKYNPSFMDEYSKW